jgi:hypothetical protein
MRYEERQENMRMLMGTMASFAAALTGKEGPKLDMSVLTTKLKADDTSDVSSSESVVSSDSSLTSTRMRFAQRLAQKRRRAQRKKRRLASLKKRLNKSPGNKGRKSPNKDDDDESSSGSEIEVSARDLYRDRGAI